MVMLDAHLGAGSDEDKVDNIAATANACTDILIVVHSGVPDQALASGLARGLIEARLYANGFRKHPRYYAVNNADEFERDSSHYFVVVERIPGHPTALVANQALEARCARPDMLRVSGSASDAAIMRYLLAARSVRPGDTILDVSCGSGYGSYVLASLTDCSRVTGIDADALSIDYARTMFAGVDNLSFAGSSLRQISKAETDSCDMIVSVETPTNPNHLADLMRRSNRMLRPGGRLVIAVARRVDGESAPGAPPEIHAIESIRAVIARHFLIESVVCQSGAQQEIVGDTGDASPTRGRMAIFDDLANVPASVWLIVAMKNPVKGARVPYIETVHRYHSVPENLIDYAAAYQNPWLGHSLLEIPYRSRSNEILRTLAESAIAEYGEATPDRGLGLAVLGYRMLEDKAVTVTAIGEFLVTVDAYLAQALERPHQARWRISLVFLKGLLHQSAGDIAASKDAFSQVLALPVDSIVPTLGTKTVDAGLRLGLLYLIDEGPAAARAVWIATARRGEKLVRQPWTRFVGSRDNPVHFAFLDLEEIVDKCAIIFKLLDLTAESPETARWDGWRVFHAIRDSLRDRATYAERLAEMSAHAATDRSAAQIKEMANLRAWATSAEGYAKSLESELARARDAYQAECEALVRERAGARAQAEALTSWAQGAEAHAKTLELELTRTRQARAAEKADAIARLAHLTVLVKAAENNTTSLAAGLRAWSGDDSNVNPEA